MIVGRFTLMAGIPAHDDARAFPVGLVILLRTVYGLRRASRSGRLSGGSEVGRAGLRMAGVLALAVVEGWAVGRVNPGDPGEVAEAGVARDGFGAPQGDQRRVGDELAVRAVRCAGVDLFGAEG